MKKTYMQPEVAIEKMAVEQMIAASVSGIGSEIGIGYGGVDADGKEEAASRLFDMMGE